MGKAAMCILMLQILKSGRVYKISELADLLETYPRNVIEYKKELEEAGYYIISIPGKYGGYKLDRSGTMPSLKLTDEEKKILQISVDHLVARGSLIDTKLYQTSISKVLSSIEELPPPQPTFIIPGVTLSMPVDEINKRYQIIEDCINSRTKLKIAFLSNDNVVRERIIRPYKLFIYNNAWFVLAFCETMQKVLYFKLNRIESLEIQNDKFRIPIYYNEREYIDEEGLKGGTDWTSSNDEKIAGEWVHIKLKFTGRPAMYIKEYIYGQNQIVTPIDKDTTILECDMHYRYNTMKFVLGFGPDCEVLEPEWLKDEVSKIIFQQYEKYKNK